MEHDPSAPDTSSAEPASPRGDLLSRLEAVERQVAAWAHEVRTRRVAVVDHDGNERLVTEIGDSFTELRLRLGEGRRQLDLVLVAAREPADPRATTAGVEMWLDGDHAGGFTVMPER